MQGAELKQRLVAILAADAAGYSRLMASDERATVTALDAARAVFKARIEANHGRVVDMAGDSVLAIFPTAMGAVVTALAVQTDLHGLVADLPEEQRLRFRVGLHLGDVMEKSDGTVYGDGVNIASRLQALAEPGGVMVSQSIRAAVRGKVEAGFVDQGEQTVKNIPEPVRAYSVARDSGGARIAGSFSTAMDLPLPDKPSIAVLPFSNMSADPEQEYFCDGVSEDIITELSRFRSLFVIARNSSFTFKGRAVDVRTISKELGVRYVLEGSARRAGSRLRLTAQLIDAVTGTHLWAEKYDREVTQVFDIQEELTQRIVVSIAPFIEQAERERVRRHPQDLGAYEIGVRATAKALEAYRSNDPRMLDEAISDTSTALRIDPESVLSLGAFAFCQWQLLQLGSGIDAARVWQDGIEAANRAIKSDRNDCLGYVQKAMLLAFAPGSIRLEDALVNARRAHELNPHNTGALMILAFVEALGGLITSALEHLEQLMRISPRDPLRYGMCNQFSMTHFLAGQYAEGVKFAALGIEEAPTHGTLHAWLALNCVGMGALPRARAALAEARKSASPWIERKLTEGFMFLNKEHRDRAASFLRIAVDLER